MKTRNFILSFLMMMFCSMAFGQNHWTPDYGLYPGNMSVVAKLNIDGNGVAANVAADFEIAAFSGNELRGSQRFEANGDNIIAYLSVMGEENVELTFRLYDHAKGYEYDNVSVDRETFVIDATIGTLNQPKIFNFESVAEVAGVKYGSLAKAVEKATTGATVNVINNVTLSEGIVISKGLTLNLNDNEITTNGDFYPVIRVQGNADVTVKNGNITNNDYVFVLGASDGSSKGNLTIESGKYVGEVTVASVTKGLLTIKGGEFNLQNVGQYGYTYLINCIDNNYPSSANVVVTGGKFYGFNPENNAAEGAGTDFCAEGYFAVEASENVYEVVEGLIGKGTEAEPFLIRNLKELKFFRDHVNAGKTKYNAEGVYVALAANIDMATENWSYNIGDDCNYTFDGIFDGSYKGVQYTLYNLNSIETAPKADGYICTGLFGAIYGNAVVKNLTIENVNIEAEYAGNNVAAVVGFAYTIANKTATIENVTVKGNISINAPKAYAVGTIVGYSYEPGNINITSCAVEAKEGSAITAVSGSGAIIGHAAGIVTVEESSVSNIDITAEGLVGGIAGLVSSSKSVLENNTVKNVALTATKANWVNSAAAAVGTMVSDGLTVANTAVENVNANKMVGSVYAKQPTTIVPAVEARIGDVYYTTFDNAFAAAQTGNTITVISPVVVAETKAYDMAGRTVAGENVYPIFRIQNGATMTVENANITNNDYVFVLGASDGSSAGNLIINGGSYAGTVSVASVTNGTLTINGGEFKANASEYGAQYLINCIDANYPASANVEIKGGKFYSFNPENNAAEGAGTDFCPEGYTTIYDATEDSYTVINAVAKIGETYYATLSSAIAAVKNGETIEFIANINENVTIKQTANKSFTIDGAGKTYSATISIDGNKLSTGKETLRIENVNFVAEGELQTSIDAIKSTYVHNVTVDNCTFTGKDKKQYGMILRNSYNISVMNTKAENVLELVYGNRQSNNLIVENVEVNNSVRVAWLSYPDGAIFDGVKAENVEEGVFLYNNSAAATTFSNCEFLASQTAIILEAKTTNSYRLTLKGENTFTGADEWMEVIGTNANFKVVKEDAKLDMTKTSGLVAYEGNKYYNTLAYAVKDADANVTVLKAHEITKTAVVEKDMTIDFNDKAITGDIYPVVRIQKGANVTAMNGNITNGDYIFTLGSSDETTVGNLTIENGTYVGETSVASVTKGKLTIMGGEFKVTNDPTYLINCVDRNNANGNGSAEVEIYGGTFYGFDPENNNAENPQINFCAEGYLSDDNGDGSYTVRKGEYVAEIKGGAKYESLQAAIDAAVDGDEVVMLSDLAYSWENVVTTNNDNRPVLAYVEGKEITLNMNEKKISVVHQSTLKEERIFAVVCVEENASLTVTGNGTIDVDTDADNVYEAKVTPKVAYMFWKRGTTGYMTIENGNYHMDDAEDSMVYSNGDETITVEGGTFALDAIGTRTNGFPYIFNAAGNNERSIKVVGGTYNYDIRTQHWSLEVYIPNGYALRDNGDGTWTVIAAVAYISDENGNKVTYASLTEANAAALAGQTITLLANVTENVTFTKNLTIDGDKFKYTGQMTLNKVNVTIKNVNFVKGNVYKAKSTTGGNYTIQDCTFDGQGLNRYAVELRNTNNIVIENVTAKDYGYGFLQIPSANVSLSIKNVEISDVNYGLKIDYSNGVTLENVVITDAREFGMWVSNYSSRTYNIKNCEINSIEIHERYYDEAENNPYTNNITFKFTGANKVGALDNQYAKYVLNAVDATLEAPKGHNVTTTVEGHVAVWNEGVYSVQEAVAAIGDEYFVSIQDAIDAAEDYEKVVVLKDVTLDADDINTLAGSYNTFLLVENKTITIDLNGHTIIGDVTGVGIKGGVGLVGLISINGTGDLTLEDNVGGATVKVENATDTDPLYALLSCFDGTNKSALTIEGGNYSSNAAQTALIHSAPSEKVVINGGNFYLGNVNTGTNGQPWIFNANGNNERNIIVNGGTYNYDINHQYWAFEVNVPVTKAIQNNGNGTWTVVDAVATAVERNNGRDRTIGYASLADAVKFVKENGTVTVTADHVTTVSAVVEKAMTIDFNDKAITGDIYPVVRIQNNANVTVKNGNITNGDYIFTLGSSDQTTAGYLTIEGGNYVGETTVAQVTKGNLVINGGEFSIVEFENSDYAYVINCYDASYNAEPRLANVSISGGTFHNWNPENNAAEGVGTNFCAAGYGAVETTTGSNIWTVVPLQTVSLIKGWNWYSTYINYNNISILQTALDGKAEQIKNQTSFSQYNNGSWTTNPLNPLNTIDVETMYMIKTTETVTISIGGEVVNPAEHPITVKPNWNWIGCQIMNNVPVNEALAGINATEGDQIKTPGYFAIYNGTEWQGSLVTMIPGRGYMYYNSSSEKELVYPSNTTQSRANENISAENNHWVSNIALYPNNMTMVAVLDIDGNEMEDNIEVAAFSNGECRGSARPIYIESVGKYMLFMTINGEGDDELTFKYYDIYSDEEYTLNDRMSYSDNAMIGSIDEPYMFKVNTLGIGENAANTISLYPNPTTINTAISFEATCDMIEVFNALGVKVAEYRNVDSIDGIEEAGVYVIRVTNDSTVQNCRLIVK